MEGTNFVGGGGKCNLVLYVLLGGHPTDREAILKGIGVRLRWVILGTVLGGEGLGGRF